MTDRVDTHTRNRIMRANRGKNTGPEIEVRKAFHAKGFRYRIHNISLPGKPDLVFARYHVVVFVNGCFWHGHDCKRRPHSKSNREFWEHKIEVNKKRDFDAKQKLLRMGWRILVIWECAVRRQKPPFAESIKLNLAALWMLGNGEIAELSENGFQEPPSTRE